MNPIIAITARGKEAASPVDNRFGRCEYLVFFNPETLRYSAVENPSRSHTGGAGVNSAQFLANRGVKTLLTGNVGPKALQVLQTAGIEVFTEIEGSVADAVDDFEKGKLKKLTIRR